MGDLIVLQPAAPRTCHNCKHARHGSTTFCTAYTEVVLDEVDTASDCPFYELED